MGTAGPAFFGAVLGLLALPGAATAQFGKATLDPKTHRSPSGEYALFVDPSQPSGAGSASYRFDHNGAELWSGARPWTLWSVLVTDEGLVAGYAYAAGYDGGRDDAVVLVLLDPSGKPRLEERTKRTGINGHHGLPKPMVNDLFVDEANERMFVRLSGDWETGEAWWTFRLSTGEAELRLFPRTKMIPSEELGWIHAVRAVPGLPFVLAHWGWNDFSAHRYGAVYTLHDRDGEVRWRLDWPDDYTIAGDEDAEDLLRREIRERGAILGVSTGHFTLRQVARGERVTFEVREVTGQREGLEVREVSRGSIEAEPETAANESSVLPAAGTLELAHLRTIVLGEEGPASPIHDVMDFGLDGRGRIGMVCRTGESFAFLLVDDEGEVLGSLELPRPPENKWWVFRIAWVGGTRWVVTGSGAHEDKDKAWWLDTAAWSLAPIENFAPPSIESLAGTGDGGFVVLGTTWYRSGYVTNDMLCIGADGGVRWALGGDQGNPSDPSTLFAPEAVTVTSDRRVAVISNIQDSVSFFSAEGDFLRSVELATAWGREPNYPTGIRPDLAGGLIVNDFNGHPPIVRMDRDDHVTASFQPRFPDGRLFRIRGDVQVGPDGTLWTSDGESLLALDSGGVVARVVGSAPDCDRLGRIEVIALGPGDRIHAADERTAAVHVFDARGFRQHVCRPSPTDFDGPLSLAHLTVDERGEVALARVQFDASGARLGKREARSGTGGGREYPQHGGRRWNLGRRLVQLMETDGRIVRSIERTSDGTWLRDLDRAAVAPDGSIAITDSPGAGDSQRVCIFSAAGEPLQTLALPPGVPGWSGIAFDGERMAFGLRDQASRRGTVLLMDLAGKAQRFEPPREAELWTPFFAAGGTELWLFDGERRLEVFSASR